MRDYQYKRFYYNCLIDAWDMSRKGFEQELQRVKENHKIIPIDEPGRYLLDPKSYVHFIIDRAYITSNVIGADIAFTNLKITAEELLRKGIQVDISIYERGSVHKLNDKKELKYFYKYEDFRKIQELNDHLVKLGMKKPIVFVEDRQACNISLNEGWSLESVYNANNETEKVAYEIAKRELSPFEAMLYIHDYVTKTFKYSDVEDKGFDEKGRSVTSAYQDKELKNYGYASVIERIIKHLKLYGYEGCLDCGLKDYSPYAIIRIKDNKYKIDGCYVENAGMDAKERANDCVGLGFANCMYPVVDLLHFRNPKSIEGLDVEGCKKSVATFKKVSGKPIPVAKYSQALVEVYTKQGYDKDTAERMAYVVINYSAQYAKEIFSKMAKSQLTSYKPKELILKDDSGLGI